MLKFSTESSQKKIQRAEITATTEKYYLGVIDTINPINETPKLENLYRFLDSFFLN